MKQLFFLVTDYLNGKSVYATIRRLLSLIFSLYITSRIFETFYFKYQLIDLTDVDEVIRFFVNGRFVIPFSVFAIVHCSLEFLPFIIDLLTKKIYNNITTALYNLRMQKCDYATSVGYFYKLPFLKIPVEFKQKSIKELCLFVKLSITDDDLASIEEISSERKHTIKSNLTFFLKAIIVATLAFFSLPYFGIAFYLSILFVLITAILFLFVSYIVMDILPSAAKRFHFHALAYLELAD